MQLCIFEDSGYTKLFPLTHFRPVYELRCGILTLREKIQRHFPDLPVTLACRSNLSDVLKESVPDFTVNAIEADDYLFVNGAVLADASFVSSVDLDQEGIYRSGDRVAAAVVRGNTLNTIRKQTDFVFSMDSFIGLPTHDIKAEMIEYPWDLIHRNAEQISIDVEGLKLVGLDIAATMENVALIQPERIYVAEDAKVKAGVVLDAEDGPIVIDRAAEIMPHATIIGPAYIGPESKIKVSAKIYEGTSIGEYCKVGGEIEECIIHSFSNKQHDGFLGHAYLGQWVNLGADTNNSDLKNNYGSVKVIVNGESVDSGSMFVGSTIGDHAKTGINTMLNSGTVIGVFANVFGGDFPPKFVPSFSWGGKEGFVEYKFDKAMETASRVMGRRDKILTPAQEALYKEVFELTRSERQY